MDEKLVEQYHAFVQLPNACVLAPTATIGGVRIPFRAVAWSHGYKTHAGAQLGIRTGFLFYRFLLVSAML